MDITIRLQEIANEFDELESNPASVVAAPPTPHPDCKALHTAYYPSRDAALAMLGKHRSQELFAMQALIGPTAPSYPLLRDTIKQMYRVCFGMDEDTIEAVVQGRGF